jgi:hypothetical protein
MMELLVLFVEKTLVTSLERKLEQWQSYGVLFLDLPQGFAAFLSVLTAAKTLN